MKRAIVMLLLAALVGCATSTSSPPAREIVIAAPVDEVLATGLEVLTERGFVIRLADAELGRIDAVRAARSGYVVRLQANPVEAPGASGTRLALWGRRGGHAIEPWRFDTLLAEIAARLEARP